MTISQCFLDCRALKVTIIGSSGKRIFKSTRNMNKKLMKIATDLQETPISCTRFARQMKHQTSSLNADFNLQTRLDEAQRDDTCQRSTDTAKCQNKLYRPLCSSNKFKMRKWRWKTPENKRSMTTTTLESRTEQPRYDRRLLHWILPTTLWKLCLQ